MTGVFVQVRLGSVRLPGKALIPIEGRPAIEHVMRSLRRVPASVHALVTDASSEARLASHAARCGFRIFTGPEEHVLERYVLAARCFGVDEIVRATGDNPLVSWELARMAVRRRRRHAADFFAYDKAPLGTGVEVVRSAALERALVESTDPYDAEHVSPYLYRNPDRFCCVRLDAPAAYRCADALVTLDTADDFARIAAIMREIYDGSPVPVIRLVRWLNAERAHGEALGAHAARA